MKNIIEKIKLFFFRKKIKKITDEVIQKEWVFGDDNCEECKRIERQFRSILNPIEEEPIPYRRKYIMILPETLSEEEQES